MTCLLNTYGRISNLKQLIVDLLSNEAKYDIFQTSTDNGKKHKRRVILNSERLLNINFLKKSRKNYEQ